MNNNLHAYKANYASLSSLVIDAAHQNDTTALAIIANGVNEVARCIEAVATYLHFGDDLRLVCVGGITKAGEIIMSPLTDAIHQRIPQCKIEQPMFSASIGAGILAWQLHHTTVNSQFLDSLNSSLNERDRSESTFWE